MEFKLKIIKIVHIIKIIEIIEIIEIIKIIHIIKIKLWLIIINITKHIILLSFVCVT